MAKVCFTGETEVFVKTEDDSLDFVEIKDLKKGQKVLQSDGSLAVINELLTYPDEEVDFSLNGIRMKDHPIYAKDGSLKMAYDLETGDELWNEVIASVEYPEPEVMTVYNLDLKGGNQFCVLGNTGPILVHNGRQL